jgi:hypothetical protein
MIDIHPPKHNGDRISEIIAEIADTVPKHRLTYKELQLNQEAFKRMHKAYAEMFERQEEFPFC